MDGEPGGGGRDEFDDGANHRTCAVIIDPLGVGEPVASHLIPPASAGLDSGTAVSAVAPTFAQPSSLATA